MPKPTKEQLRKINKFSQTELKEEQVYVFRSLSADTLPIKRFSWFGEYHITMTDKMLEKLKKDYRNGVGLLASHNSSRLPFGRTFDAEVQVDEVNGEQVNTLYIDHYIVRYVEGENGEKVPLRTEINGMTTQDIINHVEVGHTFDTSIGFSMTDIKCSICKHDLRSEDCRHYPGLKYEVQVGDRTEKVRCDIICESGEGIENSLVYAGAVNRAIIQNEKQDASAEAMRLHAQSSNSPADVKLGDTALYNVSDLKSLPIGAQLFCFLSKGNLQVYTDTNERRDVTAYIENKEDEKMTDATNVQAGTLLTASPTVSQELYDKLKLEADTVKESLSKMETQNAEFANQVTELATKLADAEAKIAELSVKAELADEFTASLIEDVVNAGIAARGNAFNAERYRKYAETLSVQELREELSAFKQEFSGGIAEAAQATAQNIETERTKSDSVVLSKAELRTEAAKLAMEQFKAKGGDLAQLTKDIYAELLEKHSQ